MEKVIDASLKYVVEEARMDGGGTGHGSHDFYPDGWRVTSRQLDGDTYNPANPTISFYMTGCFTHLVLPEDIQIVARMTRKFE